MGVGLVPTICLQCKFYKGQRYIDGEGGLEGDYVSYCDAFDEIPDIILSGENKHTEKHPDQKNNILFEKKVDKDE